MSLRLLYHASKTDLKTYTSGDSCKGGKSLLAARDLGIHRSPVPQTILYKLYFFSNNTSRDPWAGGHSHRLLTRYVKSRAAHAPGMSGTFSPPPTSNETASWWSQHTSRHVRDARAVMHVGIANPLWRGKRFRHSRCTRNPQCYISDKRPMGDPKTEKLSQKSIIKYPTEEHKTIYTA